MDIEKLLTIKKEHVYPNPLILRRSIWIPVPLARFENIFYAGRAKVESVEAAYNGLNFTPTTEGKWVLGVAASVEGNQTMIDEAGVCYWQELLHVSPAEITRSMLGGRNV